MGDGDKEVISIDLREIVSRILGLDDKGREGVSEGLEERLKEMVGGWVRD